MNLYQIGNLAKSKAGHDKNDIFVIIKEEEEYVYLVDGKLRTLEKPKRKNKKHIQPIYYKENPLYRKIVDNVNNVNKINIYNEDIKRVIKLFKSEKQIQEE